MEVKPRPYVLMIPRWYPNVQDPADGNFIERHISAISEDISTYTLFVKGLETEPKEKKVVISGENGTMGGIWYFKNRKGPLSSIINPIMYLWIQFRAYRSIKDQLGQPFIMHAHVLGRSALLPYCLRLFKKIPFVVSEHWSGYYPESGKLTWFKTLTFRSMLKKANIVTAVSTSLASAIQRIVAIQDIAVVPNIVVNRFFEQNMSNSGEVLRFVHISNFIPHIKQSQAILEVFQDFIQIHPNSELLMIGNGKAKSDLQQFVLKNNALQSKVTFTGDLPESEVAEHLSTASASVMFSTFETQSIVLLESIAMGVPVIAPRVGGIPEHCASFGILFDKNDRNGLLEALIQIASKSHTFDPVEMRTYAQERFSKEQISGQFKSLYHKLGFPEHV